MQARAHSLARTHRLRSSSTKWMYRRRRSAVAWAALPIAHRGLPGVAKRASEPARVAAHRAYSGHIQRARQARAAAAGHQYVCLFAFVLFVAGSEVGRARVDAAGSGGGEGIGVVHSLYRCTDADVVVTGSVFFAARAMQGHAAALVAAGDGCARARV